MEKRSIMSALFEYAGKFRYLTMASWVLSAASALVALIPFIYIWRIIREVLKAATGFTYSQNLVQYGWMAVIFSALSILIYVAALLCSHIAAFRVQANIRSKAMRHISTLPLGFMDDIGSGKIRRIVNESSAATETYLAHQLPDRAGAMAAPVGLLAMLLVFDWRLGILSLIPVVIAFGIMSVMTGSRMKQKMKEYQNSLEQMSNEAVEYVRGISVLKTFGQSVFSFKRFKASIDNYQKWVISYTKDLRLPMIFYTTAINAVFAVLISAALFFTADGVTGEFLLNLLFYIIITPVITVTLNKIMYSSENIMIVQDAMERIGSIMKMEPLHDSEEHEHPQDNSVAFYDVSFRYKGAEENALNHVSLHIASGQHVAFVGPSGGGKTTLASLIPRFWDVDSGRITIGGVNVKNISKEELMDNVSFVFQNSKLLKMSIFENVRLSRPDATRVEVLKALKDARCDDIIGKLSDGIDTIIGTNGNYLSGGEEQRISIARAMLKNAPILILDEATAFADPDNESKVQAAFSALSKGRTVIMIAHRLSTVMRADRIYVMKNGEICESGSHSELIGQQGLYSNMWREYNSAVKWKVGVQNDIG
ncbi:ABC transporter ATP-binding protein [Clostridium sp. MT-14]|uniref:ABC transporter ATP-binding protein/permease n=1 Tax=Clostridium aromativorans TaxID=2836848 RepID=A0ABS8NB86_9CLOT|nr:ABC transporter ATP-binding protein [Clostridium aromativorans]MCC9296429.1 ABC transporter ATP-binding protein/permease [Clostridium aromativorans]